MCLSEELKRKSAVSGFIHHLYPQSIQQYRILVKHFFRRLFINDFVDFEDHMKTKVIGALAMLAVFSGHLSNMTLWKYYVFPENGRSWVEKAYIITIFMIIMGFISVLEWEVIFLDKRDFSNLCPLPIGPRTLFLSKFTSLCMFVGLCAFSMASLSTIVFAFHLPRWNSNSISYALRYCAAHSISVFSACFFMFFVSVFIVGLMMTLFGQHGFEKISLYFRGAMLVAYVILIFFVLAESFGSEIFPFSKFYELRESNSSFLYIFPPMWFVGIYETMIGNGDLLFTAGWNFGLFGLMFFACVFFIVTGVGYWKHLKGFVERPRRKRVLPMFKSALEAILNKIFLKNMVQRSVFYFFSKTLRQSMYHKMRLIAYGAVAMAILLTVMASETLHVGEMLGLQKTLLAAPLVLSFFIITGLRNITEIPVSLEANWIFKFTESKAKHHYFAGLRKAVILVILVPFFTLMTFLYAWIWDWRTLIIHGIFGFLVAILLLEVIFIHNRKIPFACSFLPGKAKVHFFWILYCFGFILYVMVLTVLEEYLIKNMTGFLIFIGLTGFGILAVRVLQNRFYYPKAKIMYEEEPDVIIIQMRG